MNIHRNTRAQDWVNHVAKNQQWSVPQLTSQYRGVSWCMVIVKATGTDGMVTVYQEGFPDKVVTLQESELKPLKRRKIFESDSEGDDDDSNGSGGERLCGVQPRRATERQSN